ncbi:ATP-binding protein [Candidatus Peregrinibacteria bacterium]|nr:ATP-binding protein [Candidatus Peregrinibacteria bacterium]
MDPIINPYTPGVGSRPPELAGRDEQITDFTTLLKRLSLGKPQKSLIVTGLRGVGKTVLLNTFNDIAEANSFKTAKTEITHETNFRHLMARLFRRTLLALSPMERLKDQAKKALSVLKAFAIKTPGGMELSLDAEAISGLADSGNLEEDLTDLLVTAGEAAKAHNSGIILLIDEVQFLEKPDFEALISALHQVTQKNLPLSLVGAGLPQIPTLAGEAKSYAERLFEYPVIGKLNKPAAKRALLIPAKKEGVDFEDRAIEAILAFTHGYPYFLQEYGQHVWNIASDDIIRYEDVMQAEKQVVATLDENFFRVRIGRSTKTEVLYMSAMASLGEGPYKSQAIAEKLERNMQSLSPTRSSLIGKGLIYSPEYGYTDFTVPKYDDYMRRNHPIEHLADTDED